MEEFSEVMLIIAATLVVIGLIGLSAIAIITAFKTSIALGFLSIFLIGLLLGITATNFDS